MQINEIFDLSQYDEAYAFVSENEGATIQDLGDGKYQIIKLPELALDELKKAKREEINAARDAAEQGGFLYKGKVFDSDSVSCIRISSAAQAMIFAPEGTTITWTCQDNTTIDLTAEELIGLVIALADWSNTCHQKATELKAQINACKSKEELELITWKEINNSDDESSGVTEEQEESGE